MRLTPEQIQDAVGRDSVGTPPPHPLSVSTDSRTLNKGELFVALDGPNHKGVDYTAAALQKGAAGVLLPLGTPAPENVWTLRVPDTLAAYGRLGAASRKAWGGPVIAVTGSLGKSTVKELTAAALGTPSTVASAKASYNNEVGLPHTLLSVEEKDEFLVAEMGAGKPGDIDYLRKLAHPNTALYTPLCVSHGEHLGGIEGVIEEKSSLSRCWKKNQTVVLSTTHTHHRVLDARSGQARRIRCGVHGDIWASHVQYDELLCPQFIAHTKEGSHSVKLRLPGTFQVENALLALGAALSYGIPLGEAAQRLTGVTPLPHRKEVHHLPQEGLLLDDGYNAGLTSTRDSILWAQSIAKNRPLALILGDMLELGAGAAGTHIALGRMAARQGFKRLWSVGPLAALASQETGLPGGSFSHVDDLVQTLKEWSGDGWVVLVKGSRANHLDRAVNALLGAAA
ncbi:UDP-N-acetylmuramoyl-tripeptide--D-alanyl-D-alanine ligase [bacterium]|nr:UDP-N-acetylmuramoyl-tripeptide--D-alanyl-D-alanine ligase [bacterium]